MATPIRTKALTEGPGVFYSQAFRDMIETHVSWLQNHSRTRTMTIEPADGLMYQGDLDGLLLHLGIPKHMHWIVMRVNGMTSPLDYRVEMSALTIPDDAAVVDLQRKFKTSTATV